MVGAKELSEAKGLLQIHDAPLSADEPSSWGIIDKQTDRLVGTIGWDYSEDNASVELGYSLAHWLWNGGYMTEALSRVIDYV